MSPLRYLMVEIVKKLLLAVRFFTAKRVMSKASALTYSTLLAIVPILAVVFAIARGFGFNKYTHHKIDKNYGTSYDRAQRLGPKRSLLQDWADYCFSKCPPNWLELAMS